MWTPTLAMLWESWRLSRRRLAVLMAIATFGGATLLASPMSRDWSPLFALNLAAFTAWLGQARLAAPDPRKGFTLPLGFARPVATWKLVTVPLAFVAVAVAVTYLVPVVVLRGAFGVAFPLLPMAALCSTAAVVWVAAQWWTGDPAVRRITAISLVLVFVLWGVARSPTPDDAFVTRWSQIASLSAGAYIRMALLSVAALAVAILGVARQRRGADQVGRGALTTLWGGAGEGGGLPTWLADRIGFGCPVSSPTRAQLWVEVSTVGGRVTIAGLAAGLLALAFLSLANMARAGPELASLMLMVMVVPMLVAVSSVLGLRRRHGHVSMGVFAATRALGTARLVGLKVLVGSVALFVAWGAIVLCLWIFVRWIVDWDPGLREDLSDYLPAFPAGVEGVWMGGVAAVQVTAAVAGAAALHALLVLNARRIALGALGVALYVTSVVLLVTRGWVDGDLISDLHGGVLTVAFLLGIGFLLRRGLVERVFSARGLVVVVASGLAFALATRRMNSAWVNPGGNDLGDQVIGLLIGLFPLAATALAPWAFNRLRHR